MVDWGYKWPLSDFMWKEEERPDWDTILTQRLRERLVASAAYFEHHAQVDSGWTGGEEDRKWFDLEGVRLLNELTPLLEDRFRVRLRLWY